MSTQRTYIYSHTVGFHALIGRGFNNPVDVAVGRDGTLYVVNRVGPEVQVRMGYKRVTMCTVDEEYLGEFGSGGSGDGQMVWPASVAIDRDWNVYISDEALHRVSIFDAQGRFLDKWGVRGSGDGELDRPSGIAFDSEDNLLVADSLNHRIQRFTSDGRFRFRSFLVARVIYVVLSSGVWRPSPSALSSAESPPNSRGHLSLRWHSGFRNGTPWRVRLPSRRHCHSKTLSSMSRTKPLPNGSSEAGNTCVGEAAYSRWASACNSRAYSLPSSSDSGARPRWRSSRCTITINLNSPLAHSGSRPGVTKSFSHPIILYIPTTSAQFLNGARIPATSPGVFPFKLSCGRMKL